MEEARKVNPRPPQTVLGMVMPKAKITELSTDINIGGLINLMMRQIPAADRPEMQLRFSGREVKTGHVRATFLYVDPDDDTAKEWYASFHAFNEDVLPDSLQGLGDQMTEILDLFNWLGYPDDAVSDSLIESFFNGHDWIGDTF